MLRQHSDLEKRVQESMQQVWGNQEELKGGMDAAEFNLRAHQKVLNAFAIEFENLLMHLNDEVFRQEHKLSVLELADVTLPPEADEAPVVVRRLNWPYYHDEVESDLKLLSEVKDKDEEEEAPVVEETPPVPQEDNIPEGATVFGG